jgi:hypothetical protein
MIARIQCREGKKARYIWAAHAKPAHHRRQPTIGRRTRHVNGNLTLDCGFLGLSSSRNQERDRKTNQILTKRIRRTRTALDSSIDHWTDHRSENQTVGKKSNSKTSKTVDNRLEKSTKQVPGVSVETLVDVSIDPRSQSQVLQAAANHSHWLKATSASCPDEKKIDIN